jgi:hypothetical protein
LGAREQQGASLSHRELDGAIGTTGSHRDPLVAIWSHGEPKGPIWSHREPKVAIGRYMEP